MRNTLLYAFCLFMIMLSTKLQAESKCISGNCEFGYGTILYPNNHQYTGEFKDGKREGQGIYQDANNKKYIGGWKANLQHGEGRKYNSTKLEQAGFWQKGQLIENTKNIKGCLSGDCVNGYGIYLYPSGIKYIGIFQNGIPYRQGVCYYPDGSKYIGEWVNEKRNGQGIYYTKTHEILEGIWKNDAFIGKAKSAKGCIDGNCVNGTGTYVYRDYTKYVGSFKNARANGYGVCYYANGDMYVGQWKAHNFDGMGTFFSNTGEIQAGQWKDGHYQGTQIASSTKVWAVIVGIGSYPNMKSLKFTDDDAYHFHSFLKSPEGGALKDEQITILIDEDATRSNILKTLEHVSKSADKDDVILFYFSGHGFVGGFVPHDYLNKSDLVKNEELMSILEKSQAKSKIVLADACHSGSLGMQTKKGKPDNAIANYYNAFEQTTGGTVLILSSRSDESSIESKGLRQGIFSHFLIRGLKGEADEDGNKIVIVQELFDYIKVNVWQYTGGSQTPVIHGVFDKNIPLGVIR